MYKETETYQKIGKMKYKTTHFSTYRLVYTRRGQNKMSKLGSRRVCMVTKLYYYDSALCTLLLQGIQNIMINILIYEPFFKSPIKMLLLFGVGTRVNKNQAMQE